MKRKIQRTVMLRIHPKGGGSIIKHYTLLSDQTDAKVKEQAQLLWLNEYIKPQKAIYSVKIGKDLAKVKIDAVIL